MWGFEPTHVLHGQGQSGLQGVHGHVLRAVVGEDPFHLLEHADQGDVSHQEYQPDHAFDYLAEQGRVQQGIQGPSNQQRSHEEQPDTQHQRDPHGGGHHPT